MLLLALLCAGLAGGCGDGEGDGEKGPGAANSADRAAVQKVVARYVGAYLDGRGEEACALYTDRLRERIERRAKVRKVESCDEAVEVASQVALTGQSARMRGRVRDLLADPGRVTVRFEAKRAIAGLQLPGSRRSSSTRLALERVGADWRISEVGVTGARR